MRNVDTPYGVASKDIYGGRLHENMMADAIVKGLKEQCGGRFGSAAAGEIIRTEYWHLDNKGFFLNGLIRISPPIGERQDLADCSRKNHPENYLKKNIAKGKAQPILR